MGGAYNTFAQYNTVPKRLPMADRHNNRLWQCIIFRAAHSQWFKPVNGPTQLTAHPNPNSMIEQVDRDTDVQTSNKKA